MISLISLLHIVVSIEYFSYFLNIKYHLDLLLEMAGFGFRTGHVHN